MAKKIKCYVDTSAFIAFLDRSDTYHTLFAHLFSDPPPLITSALVIAEGHGWFLKRYDTTRALQFLEFIKTLKKLSIQPAGSADIEKSTHYLKKFSDQSLTLVDATSLYLMDHHKIKSCWSTDRHLGLTNVPLVIYQTD